MAEVSHPHVKVQSLTGGTLVADIVAPAGDLRGTLVLFHDGAGRSGNLRNDLACCAAAGYRVVAPHLYHRIGDPDLRYADSAGILSAMGQLHQAELIADVDEVVAALRALEVSPEHVGVLGMCLGGTVAFLAGCVVRFGAAVTFYGGEIAAPKFDIEPLVAWAPRLRTPWLGLYGDLDTYTPVEEVEQLQRAVAGRSVPTQLHRYAEAGHAFLCKDRPDHFHPEAAADAWRRAFAWFDEHLSNH